MTPTVITDFAGAAEDPVCVDRGLEGHSADVERVTGIGSDDALSLVSDMCILAVVHETHSDVRAVTVALIEGNGVGLRSVGP